MAIDPDDYYGSIANADLYFSNRLHETDWQYATSDDKAKALLAATEDINALVFAGYKSAVYDLLEANPKATEDEIAAASATQPHEFPRDGSDAVPADIETATYEIAVERLRGRDPQSEYENLTITSEGIGATRPSFDRSNTAPQHLANGIVSYLGWRYLKPYLAPNDSFTFRRTS